MESLSVTISYNFHLGSFTYSLSKDCFTGCRSLLAALHLSALYVIRSTLPAGSEEDSHRILSYPYSYPVKFCYHLALDFFQDIVFVVLCFISLTFESSHTLQQQIFFFFSNTILAYSPSFMLFSFSLWILPVTYL